jgi:hypothetical protein
LIKLLLPNHLKPNHPNTYVQSYRRHARLQRRCHASQNL